jgi:hypothetical protein
VVKVVSNTSAFIAKEVGGAGTTTVTIPAIYTSGTNYTGGALALLNQVQLPTGNDTSDGLGDILSGRSAVYKIEADLKTTISSVSTSVGKVTIEQGTGTITIVFTGALPTDGGTAYIAYLTVKTIANGTTVSTGLTADQLSIPLKIKL